MGWIKNAAPVWLCAVAPMFVPAAAQELPEGPGKDLVQTVCSGCHSTRLIVSSAGYTREGWRDLTSAMVDLSGSPAEDLIPEYLAAHFPENTRRAPTLVPGDVEIRFQEWKVPTLGQRPRDPIQAADGAIWWAGQWGNLIGRIDPVSGEMSEYPLPENAMPHTVTLDRAGKVWFTGNKNGTVGSLAPETGEITVCEMPDPAARDPHSAIFDDAGILWFTLQHSNMAGRLDPANGEVKLRTMPTPGSRPYGIKIGPDGAPWVACNGSNCLVRIDPRTFELREYQLPDPSTTVRRLDFASDGMIWYVNSSLGRLGRFDPASGAVKEWPSPSGPRSHPYAIAVVDDIVWYNESGMRPDTLVRFDPASETFQSWAIPSGDIHAGIVRHMRTTREGDLLIHQGATNRVQRVTLQKP